MTNISPRSIRVTGLLLLISAVAVSAALASSLSARTNVVGLGLDIYGAWVLSKAAIQSETMASLFAAY